MLAGEGMLMGPVGTLKIHLEEVLPLIQHLVAPSRVVYFKFHEHKTSKHGHYGYCVPDAVLLLMKWLDSSEQLKRVLMLRQHLAPLESESLDLGQF